MIGMARRFRFECKLELEATSVGSWMGRVGLSSVGCAAVYTKLRFVLYDSIFIWAFVPFKSSVIHSLFLF